MGKFSNDLKRKFTASKTRHMDKSIESMKDSTGFIKKLLKQMESDAVFFKTCEEKFDRAIHYISADMRFARASRCLYTTTDQENIFKEIYAHKINWYYMGDDDISDFATSTNDALGKLNLDDSSAIEHMFSILEHSISVSAKCKDPYYTDTTPAQRKQIIQLLEKYKKFCRETKQKIKDLFEITKKQFEKSAKKEGYSLNQLSQLTNTLEKALAESNFTDALNTLAKIETWYTKERSESNNSGRIVTDKTHLIAKNYISNFIKTKLRTLCNDINKKLESYIEAYEGKESNTLTYKERSTLNNLYTTLEDLILQCLNADQNTLESIGISEPQLTPLRTYMYQAVYPFLFNSQPIKICDINIDAYVDSVNDILKKWK